MWRSILPILCLLFILGCESSTPTPRTPTDAMLFGPAAMRIHPIFTQVKDWTGDNNLDGIEALIELQDQFGDPTKASGQVVFELFEFRKYDPDPRGLRLANPWIGDLGTLEAQRQRWNRTSRTYSFQLAFPQVQTDRSYVLTATFELSGGGRFFDQIIIAAPEPQFEVPTSRPAKEPSSAPATAPTTSVDTASSGF
jgi:hypothetical protein